MTAPHRTPGSASTQLREITNRLDDIEAIKDRLDQISADLSVLTHRVSQPKT